MSTVETLREYRNFNPQKHFFLSFFLLSPTIFIRFQPHHDGYVLQTSRFFIEAVRGNMEYPFSQYGPLWSLLLGFIGLLAPQPLLLIGIRLFSVFAISISLFISAKIYQLVSKKDWPIAVTLVVAFTWYFFGPYYGWPSIFILPIIALLSLSVCRVAISGEDEKDWSFRAGAYLGLIQMARVQVGILLLITLSLFFLYFLKRKLIKKLLLGYASVILLITLFLLRFGFLSDAIYDQYYFGLKFHISSDRGASRIPIWTILIALLTWICIRIMREKQILFPIKIFSFAIFLIFTIENLFTIELLKLFHWRIVQRLFVGILLGVMLFLTIEVIINCVKKTERHSIKTNKPQLAKLALTTISLCVMSQMYPLFAAHHAWYSLIPLLLSFSLIFHHKEYFSPNFFSYILRAILLVSMFSYTTSWYGVTLAHYQKAPFSYLVYLDETDRQLMGDWKKFADKFIPLNSKVQNLCQDPTIFVVRGDLTPASRNFLWWKRFEQFEQYRKSLQKESDFLLICNEIQPDLRTLVNLQNYKEVAVLNVDSAVVLYSKKDYLDKESIPFQVSPIHFSKV